MTESVDRFAVSVVIPTHNPRMDFLVRVIEALRVQTLAREQWELVVIDNNSQPPLRVSVGPEACLADSAGIRQTATGAERRWVARQPNGIREEGALAGVGGQESGDSKGSDSREKAQEEEAGDRGQEAGDRSAGQQDYKTSLSSHVPTFPPSTAQLDLSWHGNARIVREERVGLTNARLRGFAETSGEVIVLVDDDNVLAPDYLEQVARIAGKLPFLGVWSGQVVLELEPGSEQPRRELRHLLCERTVERDVWSNDPRHLAANPWGAGECIRREVAEAYAALVEREPRRRQLDLQGQDLVYGGDTDIAYTGCKHGWGMGVFAALRVTHVTPKARCTEEYLLRRYEGQAFSNVLHHWVETGALPERQRSLPRQLGGALRWLSGGSFHRAMVSAGKRGTRRGLDWVRASAGSASVCLGAD